MNRDFLIKTYITFSVIAAACLVCCALGLLMLYVQGFPMKEAVPQPIAAMLYGYGLFGVIAMICYVLAKKQGPKSGLGAEAIAENVSGAKEGPSVETVRGIL